MCMTGAQEVILIDLGLVPPAVILSYSRRELEFQVVKIVGRAGITLSHSRHKLVFLPPVECQGIDDPELNFAC